MITIKRLPVYNFNFDLNNNDDIFLVVNRRFTEIKEKKKKS
jgi:hypothetical protein